VGGYFAGGIRPIKQIDRQLKMIDGIDQHLFGMFNLSCHNALPPAVR
jgi:hypothetical protein